jgi:hypothetical protein
MYKFRPDLSDGRNDDGNERDEEFALGRRAGKVSANG